MENQSQDQIQQMKSLLSDMNEVNKFIFWRDLILLSLVGWISIIYTAFNYNLIIFLIGTYSLYKGTMLIHEVSHLSKKIPGYKLAYNILLGYPNSYPAYIYDTHLFHHGKKTYGTVKDPEYAFIKDYSLITLIRPLLTSFLLPIMQVFRFVILPLITPFSSINFKRALYQKYSTLVFSLEYIRPIKNESKELKMMMTQDLICSVYKVVLVTLVLLKVLPFQFIINFYFAFVIASLINMYRALFNHLYANETLTSLSWEDHLLDTATIKSGFFTKLIFVNGLSYHAIHHLFPEMPYHNLEKAHKILEKHLPDNHIYKQNIYSGPLSLAKFCMSKHRLGKLSVNH
jgi:fatty acid desaturase